jgi:acyl transferase domain-containing protein
MLREGGNSVGEIPPDRFDVGRVFDPRPGRPGRIYSRHGGFLDGVDRFDADFFGIPFHEAVYMDPQQRLLLEVSWEALEDAGQAPGALAGKPVGVFMGILSNEYADLLAADLESFDISRLFGPVRSGGAARVSHALGARGPSLVVDTACSSSLTALHLACQSLWSGESCLALAGGTQLNLKLHTQVAFSQGRLLSLDGCCRFGDRQATGFVRTEGVAVVVLKPLARALADGDPVYAAIRGTSINHDGASGGSLLTAGREGKEALFRTAYAQAGFPASEVDYVEAHGLGSPTGDPVEIEALGRVFGEGRPHDRPLKIGSVKTNLGHADAVAGVSGIIKMALSLAHEEIPPSLHFAEPNPAIPWRELPVEVARDLTPWPRGERPRRAGVNAFGINGSNAHVILEEAPPPVPAEARTEGGAGVLLLSAKSLPALADLARSYVAFLEGDGASLPWRDVCAASALRRDHHGHRLAVTAGSAEEAAEILKSHLAGEEPLGLARGTASGDPARVSSGPSGQGSPDLTALGALHVGGWPVDWGSVYPEASAARLPSYAWERGRYWFDPVDPASRPGEERARGSSHPLLGRRLGSAASPAHFWETDVALRGLAYLRDHGIAGAAVMPVAVFLELLLAAAAETFRGRTASIEGLRLETAFVLGEEPRRLQLVMTEEAADVWSCRIFGRMGDEPWTAHAAGTLRLGAAPTGDFEPLAAVRERCARELSRREIYEGMAARGPAYGPRFRNVSRLWCGGSEAVAWLEVPKILEPEIASYGYHPALLDAGMHAALAALLSGGSAAEGPPLVPAAAELVQVFQRPSRVAWIQLVVRGSGGPEGGGFKVDLLMRDEREEPALEIRGLRFQPWPSPLAASPGDRAPEVEAYLGGLLGRLLGPAAAGAGLEEPLPRLGVDSLTAIEIRNRLEIDLGVSMPLVALLASPSVTALAREITDRLGAPDEPRPPRLAPAPAGAERPLSFAQQRLWFMEQLQPGDQEMAMSFSLQGPLDEGAFGRAAAEIVRRHEVLRTGYLAADGRPFQVVGPPVPWLVLVVDLAALPEAAHEAEARRLVRGEGSRPLRLERPPAVAATLVRLGENRRLLRVQLHHIAMDGWSWGLFLRELATLYRDFATAGAASLPGLPVQYGDFAFWQNGRWRGEALEAQLGYWRRALAGAPARLRLPADRPGRRGAGRSGERLDFVLPPDLSAAVLALGRRENVTSFTLLLAVFDLLLSRWAGQDDVVVGVNVSQRPGRETEEMIGCFINTLLLRVDLSGDPTFLELLGRVRKVVLDGLEHQQAPYDRVVQELSPERIPGHNPLAQVAFEFGHPLLPAAAAETLADMGIAIEHLPLPDCLRWDLYLYMMEEKGRLSGAWVYADDLFERTTVAHAHRRLESLLGHVVEHPGDRLSALDARLAAEEEERARAAAGKRAAASRKRLLDVKPKAVEIDGGQEGLAV